FCGRMSSFVLVVLDAALRLRRAADRGAHTPHARRSFPRLSGANALLLPPPLLTITLPGQHVTAPRKPALAARAPSVTPHATSISVNCVVQLRSVAWLV